MKLLIAGGGTGGHVFPAVAVADAFMTLAPSPRVVFVGTPTGLEGKLVPANGYSLYLIAGAGWKGKGVGSRLRALVKLPLGLVGALRIILSYNPDVVLGVGGYASVAVCLMAWLTGRPIVLDEQNAVPGATNRTLARLAKWIGVAFAPSAKYFPANKAHHIGLPMRRAILAVESTPPPGAEVTILIFGGSQGAQAINRGVSDALPLLTDLKPRLRFVHQTGESDWAAVQAAYQASGFVHQVQPFIHDMAAAYRNAHLVIARSGASIMEIAACGRPSILVPFPFAADNHQQANAEIFVEKGAAKLVANHEFTGQRCAQLIRELVDNPTALADMRRAAIALSPRDAAEKLAEQCIAFGETYRGAHAR